MAWERERNPEGGDWVSSLLRCLPAEPLPLGHMHAGGQAAPRTSCGVRGVDRVRVPSQALPFPPPLTRAAQEPEP